MSSQTSPYFLVLSGMLLFVTAALVMLRYAGREDITGWQAQLNRSRAWHTLSEVALFVLLMMAYFLAGAVFR